MNAENQAKMDAVKHKAMGIVEKHAEAMALELADMAKEMGDVMTEEASPLVKLVYSATKEQMVALIKGLVTKLDLDGDGK
jgi:hypothetical protein